MESIRLSSYAYRVPQTASVDRATLYGIFVALGLIVLAIGLGGGLTHFISLQSIFIVVGGTIGATLVAFPLDDFRKTLTVLRTAFFPESSSAQQRMTRLLELARRARSGGPLALQPSVYHEPDPFLARSIELLVDGLSGDDLRKIFELEVSTLEDRHRRGAELFQTMGTIAPAMGLIGTLIGLVQMLQTLDNPANVAPAMGIALLTTFYGAILANVIFFPLARKLAMRSNEEALIKRMTIEGIVCIFQGMNPRILEQRLLSFLAPEDRSAQFG